MKRIQKRVWIGLAIILIAGGGATAVLHHSRGGVPYWIHALKREDSIIDFSLQTLWPKLPASVQTILAQVGPVPASESHDLSWTALSSIGPKDKDSVGLLISALDDPSIEVRSWSLQAIGRIGPSAEEATKRLLEIVRDLSYRKPVSHGTGSLRGAAARALGTIAPVSDSIFSILLKSLKETIAQSPKPALEQIYSSRAGAVTDWDPDIAQFFCALTDLSVRAADPGKHLNEILDANPPTDKYFQVYSERARLVSALANVRPVIPRVLETLTSLFEYPDSQVQLAAIQTLGQLGPLANPSLPEVAALLDRTENGQVFNSLVYPGNQNSALHRQAIITIGCIGKDSAGMIPRLIREYQNSTNAWRFDAALARWRIDGEMEETISVLRSGLADPRIRWRTAALQQAAAMASCPEALDLIIQELHDPEMGTRTQAIETLSNLGPKAARKATPDLIELTNDPKYRVRFLARELLKKIRAKGPN